MSMSMLNVHVSVHFHAAHQVWLHNGTLHNGTLQNGTLQNGTLQNGTLQNECHYKMVHVTK